MGNIFAPYDLQTEKGSGPIRKVQPLREGVLKVWFATESVLEIPLTPHFREARIHPLSEGGVWNSAATDGFFVRWYRDGKRVVELAWDELLQLALGPDWI